MRQRILLLASRFLEKAVMFLFFVVLARSFGPESFGEFSYLFALAALVFVIVDNGGDLYQIPLLARYGSSRSLFGKLFLIKTFLFLLVLLLVSLLHLDGKIYYLLASFYLESLISLGRSLLYHEKRFVRESLYHSAEKTILLVLMLIAGVWIKQLILMYLAFSLAKLVYISLLLPRIADLARNQKSPAVRVLIQGSWSYVLHAVLIVSMLQLDIVLLKYLGAPYEQIALYSAAMRIIMALIVIPQTLFNLYYPDVSRFMSQRRNDALKQVIEENRAIEWGGGMLLMFTIALVSPELIHFMYGVEFQESARILLMLSPLILLRFTKYTDSAIISASDYNRWKLYTTLVVAVGNICLNLVLIPSMGIYGAVTAILLSDLGLWLGFRFCSRKINAAARPAQRDFLVIVAAGTAVFMIYMWLHGDLWLRLILLLMMWLGALRYMAPIYSRVLRK